MLAGEDNPRRVMVGTDRSETAERAVRWAASFAGRFAADLHVVQVMTPHTQAGAEPEAADPRLARSTDDLLRHVRSLAGDRGYGRVIIDNDPAMAILRAAAEDQIDVLVVGNAGMAGRKEFLLGNVPNRISHNARCTVVIVNTIDGHGDGAMPGLFRSAAEARARPRRITRGSQIIAVFARHGIRGLFGGPDLEGATGRRRQAKRLRAALEELGPTFAKIGQLLSTRPDLLPPEFIEELSQLRDRVTPLAEEQVVRVMEEDLRVPWEDVFETIEPEPLATGSIAQVHRATLASHDKVVVKIQRPEAGTLIRQDLAVLEFLARKLGKRRGVRSRIDVHAVFEHVSKSLLRELDFRLEARSAERMRGALAEFPRLAVPAVYTEFSTARLLVMQDVAGVRLGDMPDGKLRKETARQLIESFCRQVVVDGFFHADLHPGNLMWQSTEERLYFLDLGMTGEVDAELRDLMMLLLTAFWQKDADFLTEVTLLLSGDTAERTQLDIEAFGRDLRLLMDKYRGVSVQSIQFGPVLQEMMSISFRHGVPLPASLTLTAKALAQMQQSAAQLDPELDPFDIAGRYLIRSFVRRIVSGSDARTLFYQAQKLKLRVKCILEGLERLVGARPGQRQEMNFRALALEETVRCAGRRLALGFTGGFALLASALAASSERLGAWAPAALGIAGAAFALALVVDLIRGK